MPKNMLVACSMLVLVLGAALGFAGCGGEGSASAEAIAADAIRNSSELTTYKCDMSMTMDAEITGGSEAGTMSMLMDGVLAMDNVSREMQMLMDASVSMEFSGMDVNMDMEMDMYVTDGWMYMRTSMPFEEDAWTKMRAPESEMPEDSLSQMVEFLETAIKVENVGSETVDGIDCDIIEVTPDMEALLDWVLSQQEDSGMNTEDLDLEDMDLSKMFKSFSIKEWISKDESLPVKAEVQALIEIRPEDMGESFEGEDMDSMTMNMSMQCKYYDWNEPITIELPPEAQDAETIWEDYEY